MSKKFKHLNLSPHWQQYFSKYPQGYTIIENLIDWVSQVNKMVDSYNELTNHVDNFKESVNNTTDGFREELDTFLGQFDDNLNHEVVTTLSEWQNSGFLDIVIDSALETKYHEMDNRLTTQLSETEQKKANNDMESLTYISVKNPPAPYIGATGDGIVDDTTAIQTLINDFDYLYFPEGVYKISSTLISSGNVKWLGHNAVLQHNNLNDFILTSTGETKSTNKLVQRNIAIYDRTIKLNNTDDIETGDIIHIRSNQLWYYDNRDSLYKGETFEVVDVDRQLNEVTLGHSSSDGYDLQNENLTVTIIKPNTSEFIGITFLDGSVRITLSKETLFEKCLIDNKNGSIGLSIATSIKVKVNQSIIKNCYETTTGYGIQDGGSSHTQVLDSFFSDNRRGVDFSGTTPSRYGLVENCSVEANGVNDSGNLIFDYSSGFGTHGTAEMITFRGNTIQNVRIGFNIRGGNCRILNNTLIGRMDFGVASGDGDYLMIDGNTYHTLQYGKTTVSEDVSKYSLIDQFYQSSKQTQTEELTVTNNIIERVRNHFISVRGDHKKLNVSNNQTFVASVSSTAPVAFIQGDSGTLRTIDRLFNKNNNIDYGRTHNYEEIRDLTILSTVE